MKTDKLLELVCELIKEKSDSCESDSTPFEIGKAYFIRTVTYHFIGKVEKINGDFLVLSDAVWVADSGRFHEAIEKGSLSEVEYIGDWHVNIKTITDFGVWKNKIIKESK